MPLHPDFADDYARLRQDVRDLLYKVAQAKIVEAAAVVAGRETLTIPARSDSGWHSLAGPQQQITTAAGKITVTVSGRIEIGSANTNAQAAMSWDLLNENGQVVIGPDLHRGTYVTYKAGMGAISQSDFTFVHEGIAPGTYTVRARYRHWDGAGFAMDGNFPADFSNRSLIVKAY